MSDRNVSEDLAVELDALWAQAQAAIKRDFELNGQIIDLKYELREEVRRRKNLKGWFWTFVGGYLMAAGINLILALT